MSYACCPFHLQRRANIAYLRHVFPSRNPSIPAILMAGKEYQTPPVGMPSGMRHQKNNPKNLSAIHDRHLQQGKNDPNQPQNDFLYHRFLCREIHPISVRGNCNGYQWPCREIVKPFFGYKVTVTVQKKYITYISIYYITN